MKFVVHYSLLGSDTLGEFDTLEKAVSTASVWMHRFYVRQAGALVYAED